MGSTDPNTPIANGWLRASHRRLDPEKSKPWRPYHPHDRAEPLTPGEVYECDVEIVTSCIVVPAGWRVGAHGARQGLRVRRRALRVRKQFHYGTRGTGGMTHNDPDSRPAERLRRARDAARGRRRGSLTCCCRSSPRKSHGRNCRSRVAATAVRFAT